MPVVLSPNGNPEGKASFTQQRKTCCERSIQIPAGVSLRCSHPSRSLASRRSYPVCFQTPPGKTKTRLSTATIPCWEAGHHRRSISLAVE